MHRAASRPPVDAVVRPPAREGPPAGLGDLQAVLSTSCAAWSRRGSSPSDVHLDEAGVSELVSGRVGAVPGWLGGPRVDLGLLDQVRADCAAAGHGRSACRRR